MFYTEMRLNNLYYCLHPWPCRALKTAIFSTFNVQKSMSYVNVFSWRGLIKNIKSIKVDRKKNNDMI